MKKRFLSRSGMLLLSLVMIMTSFNCAFAASPKMSKRSLKMDSASSRILRVYNAGRYVEWRSSNTKVATVRNFGGKVATVIAHAPGKTVITAKTKGVKVKCIVRVHAAEGSRQRPGDPKKGLTIKSATGTYYIKLLDSKVGKDALNYFKEIAPTSYESRLGGSGIPSDKKLIALTFEVKAILGYETYTLNGMSVFNTSNIFNSRMNVPITDIKEWFFDSQKVQSLNSIGLYNGGRQEAAIFLLIPKEVNVFTTKTYRAGYDDLYWIKYVL